MHLFNIEHALPKFHKSPRLIVHCDPAGWNECPVWPGTEKADFPV